LTSGYCFHLLQPDPQVDNGPWSAGIHSSLVAEIELTCRFQLEFNSTKHYQDT
jgi:hypothetical protein